MGISSTRSDQGPPISCRRAARIIFFAPLASIEAAFRAATDARPPPRPRRRAVDMSNRVEGLKTFLRGIARVQRTFQIEVGPMRASGVPAVMIGIAGIILARGVSSALMQN